MCVATALQTASQSVGMFIGARCVPPCGSHPSKELLTASVHSHTTDNRFLIGFGLTFAAAAAPVTLASGTQKLEARVNITWALEDAQP